MMFKRSIIRVAGTLFAVVAGLAVSARAALAVQLPDPVGPIPGSGSDPIRPPIVQAPTSALEILGMDWQLALSVGLLAVAAVLFLATMVQHRHVAHA